MAINKRKVAIIGAGHVGSHGGYALISQGLVEELVYIVICTKKLWLRLLICRILRLIWDGV